jgi:hypothetical protein
MKTKAFTMEDLINTFHEAIDTGASYVAVEVDLGKNKKEIIVNSRPNFNDKLAYYSKTYDLALDHKHASGIRIVGACYADTFAGLGNFYKNE